MYRLPNKDCRPYVPHLINAGLNPAGRRGDDKAAELSFTKILFSQNRVS